MESPNSTMLKDVIAQYTYFMYYLIELGFRKFGSAS